MNPTSTEFALRARKWLLKRGVGKPVSIAPVIEVIPVSPKWAEMTKKHIEQMEACDPIYRPTNFWGPGVAKLISDMEELGLGAFKAWPASGGWFYPQYGERYSVDTIARVHRFTAALDSRATKNFITSALGGNIQARRDHDVVRLFWNQDRWPFDLTGFGESTIGQPLQRYAMPGGGDRIWTKPYLNYLLCLSALSQHVAEAPKSFLEIGGGYGVLGEMVMQRDPSARYVNLDIPPLLTVSSYYLTELFGTDRVGTMLDVPDEGRVAPGRSACLPNWRIGDIDDTFDVFVNSYSFQEMEPSVVAHYIDQVAAKGTKYAVSLNSIAGKPRAANQKVGGVIEQVTSAMIVKMFEEHGYTLRGQYRDPLIISAGELVVLERD